MVHFLKLLSIFIILSCQVSTGFGNEDTNYTETEKKALKEFRVKVQDLIYLDYHSDDPFLITWLRTADLDQTRARQLLEKTVKWRKEDHIDTILQEKRFIQMQKQYPHSMDTVDREGRPVVIVSAGAWDLRKIMVTGHGKIMTRYIDYIFEKATKLIRDYDNSTQTDVTQALLIIDMNGFSLRTHACLRCLPFYYDLIQHYSWYYPLKAKYVILLNTTRSFDYLLRIIFPIMPPVLQKSLKIYTHDSSEYSKFLLQLIPPEQLSTAYGGIKGQKQKPKSS